MVPSLGFESKMTAISPLEGVVAHMFEKLHALALNPSPQKLLDIQQDYAQRNEDLKEFLAELEINPLGFSREETEVLKRRGLELSKKLDVIALCLDVIYQTPDAVLEIINIYSKKLLTLRDEIVYELSQIENPDIRDGFLRHNEKTKEYLKGFPLESVQETVRLINDYCKSTLKEDRSYKNIVEFFLNSEANWSPLEVLRFMFKKEDEPELSVDEDKNIRLKKIENKIAAFELQIVPAQQKPARLREIQELKDELNPMQDREDVSGLLKRLEDLSQVLVISKSREPGFFAVAKPQQPFLQ